jgi:uncharacterized protein DUF6152
VIAILLALALGHHSLTAEFDITKHVTLTGSVTKIDWVNPHAYIYIDVKEGGGLVHWGLQMGSPNGLMKRGWTKKSVNVGDVITVEGVRAKDGAHVANVRSVVLSSGLRLQTGSPQGNTS